MLDQLSPYLVSVFVSCVLSKLAEYHSSKPINYQMYLHVQRVIQRKHSTNISTLLKGNKHLFSITSTTALGVSTDQFKLEYNSDGVVLLVPTHHNSIKSMVKDFFSLLFAFMC